METPARLAAALGIVVIGRNEGRRLERSLASLPPDRSAVIYVDSGSSDGSLALAAQQGLALLSITPPYTAARARHAGVGALLAAHPELRWIQFLDGDCELAPDWILTAQAYLQEHDRVAVVCGRRRERDLEASLYNRLCDMEWNTPVGEAREFGGDALVRVEAYQQVGGFCGELIAGEEPELSVRLRQAGWTLVRLDQEMTRHDAAMSHLSQWWRRMVRSGHALAERAFRHGRSPQRDGIAERRSTLLWGVVIPALAIAGLGLTHGWSLPAYLALMALQIGRIGQRRHRRWQDSWRWGLLYGLSCVAGKFPQLWGLLTFYRRRWSRRPAELIEYKQVERAA